MGYYLNPGNEEFSRVRKGTYIDKSGLIEFINNAIEGPDYLICFSRPRRFGKTISAGMLCAYYDRSCDSRSLFEDLYIANGPSIKGENEKNRAEVEERRIAVKKSFEKHLNKYNVICLDVGNFASKEKVKNITENIKNVIVEELKEAYPDYVSEEKDLSDILLNVADKTGIKFVFIIDEWDAVFREAKYDEKAQEEYITMLRSLFKDLNKTGKTYAAVYMTGILPIKKYKKQSALNNFREYTMTNTHKDLEEYIGFTEEEVKALCEKSGMNFNEMSRWYDGYSFTRVKHVYSPNSVMEAASRGSFRSYWTSTETYKDLKDYITMNFDGLKDAVKDMLDNKEIEVSVEVFDNDMVSLEDKNTVLVLLIHLGYLGYNEKTKSAFIPNEEVRGIFVEAVKDPAYRTYFSEYRESQHILEATLHCDCETVAESLEHYHERVPALEYNSESGLRYAVLSAYHAARDRYETVNEFPTGTGFADIVFIPKRGETVPALVIELKYNKSAEEAVQQIRRKHYGIDLESYKGNMLLVGINYDEKTKKHECIIEKA